MDSSIEIMDIVIHLLNRNPANIVYLRGNHDTLARAFPRAGSGRGVIFRQALVERRGERHADFMWDFFGTLPVFVKHRRFLAVHGGPVRGGIGRSELINVAHYQDCEHQLIWNRISETYSTPSKKEYSQAVCPYLLIRDSPEYEVRYANLKIKRKRDEDLKRLLCVDRTFESLL